MADSFKAALASLLLASLLLICYYGFAKGVALDYGNSTDIVDDSQINLTGFDQELNNTANQAHGWEQAFTSDNFFVSLGSIVLFSIWGVFKLMWTVMAKFVTLIFQAAFNVLGVPSIVTGVVTMIFIIWMIFWIYKSVKTGFD